MRHIDNPHEAFGQWFEDAKAAEPDVPDAMQVATVSPDGLPRVRTVLLKAFGPEGYVFYTNLGSPKATDLLETPHVAALLHWKSAARQVHLRGAVRPQSDAAADAYFASRGRGSQIGAWASRQSQPLDDPETLRQRVAHFTREFEGRPVPRPSFWSGFVIDVRYFEFWQGRPDRLHDRYIFERTDNGWEKSLLYP